MSCVVLGKFPNLHYIYLSSDGMLMVPHRTEMVQDELSATWQAPNTLPEGQKHMYTYAWRKTMDGLQLSVSDKMCTLWD